MQQLNRQLGIAVLEALVALVVLAFGLLGLLWMHQQALAQQRQQLMRAVATGIADDLAERMRLNAPQISMYTKTWGNPTVSAADCTNTPCTRQALAAWDKLQLQQTLQTQLPAGDAAVFTLADAPQWWGIVIAWRDANETYRTDNTSGTPPCPAQMSCWRLFFRADR
ncbi:type IV pilus modification protein PilV [Limnohabitans sp. Jir61]|jgi:type IV pilus assembly protein PilV|uniref:type IV pilus modification protein PilV n=1 Tax=Limnohabitans sp. Jir61 TaxID=1826168 RepID=UPI000D39BEEE|nr:type IV pilus modification protein PilV [Limnohabitans sp. Jir61]PUE30662.1 type IV pilus modification protein PilV [Limnohabitans sp. Jir61]